MVEAVICIPSFRRPEGLRRTLASLAAQRTAISFAVVVIDNDAAGRQAEAAANAFFAETGIPGRCAVEDRQGNCFAINAAFSNALAWFPEAEFFLMIDDDETAAPAWLEQIVATARSLQADIAGGPVHRSFDGAVAGAIATHPLFRSISAPTGPIDMIHGTGNCLIRRRVFEAFAQPYFDLAFNFLGGGDMDFFTRCRKRGFRFAWCGEAQIIEHVATDRLTPRWLMRRSVRTGTINYLIDRRHAAGPGGRLRVEAKNVASLGLSLWRAAKVLARTGSPLQASHPILMSWGRIMGSLGMIQAPYKDTAPAVP